MKWTKECTWRREDIDGVDAQTDFTLTVTNNVGIKIVARYESRIQSPDPETTIVITHPGLEMETIDMIVDGIVAIVQSAKVVEGKTPEIDLHKEALHARLNMRIDDMWTSELTQFHRIRNVLRTAKIEFVGQLVQKIEPDMLKLWRLGPVSLGRLKKLLSGEGLCFGMKVDGWKPPNER